MKKFNWLNIKKYNKKQRILILVVMIIFILIALWVLNKPVYTVNDLNPDDFTIIYESNQYKAGYRYIEINSNGKCRFKSGGLNTGVWDKSITYETTYVILKDEINSLKNIITDPKFWKTKNQYGSLLDDDIVFRYEVKLLIISNKKIVRKIKFYVDYSEVPFIIVKLIDRIRGINSKYGYNKRRN